MSKKEDPFSVLPVKLKPSIMMERPNQNIDIYNGPICFVKNGIDYTFDIEIYHKWIPADIIEFRIENINFNECEILSDYDEVKIPGYVTKMGSSFVFDFTESSNLNSLAKGLINSPFVLEHKENRPLENIVTFEIFNFREFHGEVVKFESIRRTVTARIIFPADDFEIILDACVFNTERRLLREVGGYGLTNTGVLLSNKASKLCQEEATLILRKFGLFLSFLNGRRTYPRFIQGKDSSGRITWSDYSNFPIDIYKECASWLPQRFENQIGRLWNIFYQLTKDKDTFNSIDYIIHWWYIEANNNSGHLEGSIILLQNAFEIFFRWIVIEGSEMPPIQRDENLRASDKIRLLLATVNVSSELPAKYQEIYKKEIRDNNSLNNFPYMFTEIRNSLVHSNPRKREKIDALSSDYKYSILYTGLHYVELLLLKQLQFDGSIASRISKEKFRGSNEEVVPWVKVDDL